MEKWKSGKADSWAKCNLQIGKVGKRKAEPSAPCAHAPLDVQTYPLPPSGTVYIYIYTRNTYIYIYIRSSILQENLHIYIYISSFIYIYIYKRFHLGEGGGLLVQRCVRRLCKCPSSPPSGERGGGGGVISPRIAFEVTIFPRVASEATILPWIASCAQ